MRIAREEITVVPDMETSEVLVLAGSYRISLSEEESRLVARALDRAVAVLERHRAPVALSAANSPANGKEKPEGETARDALVRVFERNGVTERRPEGLRPL
jgi:hypothetical protein